MRIRKDDKLERESEMTVQGADFYTTRGKEKVKVKKGRMTEVKQNIENEGNGKIKKGKLKRLRVSRHYLYFLKYLFQKLKTKI